jgi:hypothetical protein
MDTILVDMVEMDTILVDKSMMTLLLRLILYLLKCFSFPRDTISVQPQE